jgi:hypothetical protein
VSKLKVSRKYCSTISYFLANDACLVLHFGKVKEYLAQVDIGKAFGGPVGSLTDVGNLVSRIIQSLYVIAGVILLALILWGGFTIISAAGSDDKEKVGKGKAILTSAFVGFLIVIASYWIIQIIEAITHIPIVGK